MDTAAVANARTYSQHIAGQLFDSPYDVVKHFGAMQAQDYASSLWAIGLRTKKSTQANVIEAIASRKIVRTWPMRGTLHFVAAEDIRWILTLLGGRMIQKYATRRAQIGLDEATINTARSLIKQTLSDGKEHTRKELFALLDSNGLDSTRQRGAHLMLLFALEQLICFGAHSEKQPTFVLLDEWVPPQKSHVLSVDESLARIATYFFRSHGPALVTDLSGWAGLTLAEARKAIENANIRTIAPNLYGTSPQHYSPSGTFLLPAFDEFVIGYKNRSHIMQPHHMSVVAPGNNGMFMPTIVTDGTVVGTWKRVITPKRVTVQTFPFQELTMQQVNGIQSALQRFQTYMEIPVVSI